MICKNKNMFLNVSFAFLHFFYFPKSTNSASTSFARDVNFDFHFVFSYFHLAFLFYPTPIGPKSGRPDPRTRNHFVDIESVFTFPFFELRFLILKIHFPKCENRPQNRAPPPYGKKEKQPASPIVPRNFSLFIVPKD